MADTDGMIQYCKGGERLVCVCRESFIEAAPETNGIWFAPGVKVSCRNCGRNIEEMTVEPI